MADCTCVKDWGHTEPTCSDFDRCTEFATLKAENERLQAALHAAEKALDDCLECRSHLNYEARRVVRAAIGGPTVSDPGRPTCKPDGSCCDFVCGN